MKELNEPGIAILLERIDQLNDRITNHSTEFRNGHSALIEKISDIRSHQHANKEELLKKIQEVEIGYVKADGVTNVKIATLSGTVAAIVSIIISLIKLKFGQ